MFYRTTVIQNIIMCPLKSLPDKPTGFFNYLLIREGLVPNSLKKLGLKRSLCKVSLFIVPISIKINSL